MFRVSSVVVTRKYNILLFITKRITKEEKEKQSIIITSSFEVKIERKEWSKRTFVSHLTRTIRREGGIVVSEDFHACENKQQQKNGI